MLKSYTLGCSGKLQTLNTFIERRFMGEFKKKKNFNFLFSMKSLNISDGLLIHGRKAEILVYTLNLSGELQWKMSPKDVIPTAAFPQTRGPPESYCEETQSACH